MASWITKPSLFSPRCDDSLNDVEWLRLRAGMCLAPVMKKATTLLRGLVVCTRQGQSGQPILIQP
ncbi:hypothetical protein CAL22_14270 [Bordetella genomosp. 12]|uniref:Uncharacterized protein n=1 Tax=Bordetella genomosp. 12 TaxID=463035 RepID=A0A261VBB4_9BORD|nr:hypothetical protein CAL22_14270 [Bordetella genomosp. 12]